MSTLNRPLEICQAGQLKDKQFIIVPLQFRGSPHSAIVFRHNGKVFAYLNQCVHMPRTLNCQRDTIFDDKMELLRCSMHGIVYDPVTGESLSTMCTGERLLSLRLLEVEGNIYIRDKRISEVNSP
ncbi:MAG: Rieske 2Fe-2S domain-containing protein [Gammaproteobacteria bacterium]